MPPMRGGADPAAARSYSHTSYIDNPSSEHLLFLLLHTLRRTPLTGHRRSHTRTHASLDARARDAFYMPCLY